VRVIPGIEMSVEDKGAHILGYGINHKNEKLLAELEKFKQGRIDGAKQMVENLKKDGFVVEWEDVLKEATGSIIARPHISRAVMNRPENKEKLGGISTVHDFIEKYLFNESPNYVHRAHILAKDAIGLLHEAGGVAVWSHPAIHFQIRGTEPTQTDYESLENFLKELIDWGIDGVEAFNPSHSEDDAEFVQSLAVKYKLLRTAGSDFHEKGEHPRNSIGLHSADKLGDFETYGFAIDDIVPKLDEAINKRHNPANF
jgi:predicted metal-dependent phosphoesterase TrpH